MKTRMSPLFSLPLLVLFAGCISLDMGYAPNDPVEKHAFNAETRYPVTFSLSFESEGDEMIAGPTFKGLRDRVKTALSETGLFSEVNYASCPESDSYHYSFSFRIYGPDIDESANIGNFSGSTLCCIPVWQSAHFDGSATAYYCGKPVFSAGASELWRAYQWLPLAPVGLFLNCPVGSHMVQKGVVNTLVNDLAAEHCRRYLDAPPAP